MNCVLKKGLILASMTMGMAFGAFAYNPPVQGDNLYGFLNAEQMTTGFSTAGGPLFTVTPANVVVNPALGAYKNRVSLDFGYTGIITGDSNAPYSQAFGTGILIPTNWFNVSAEFAGIFSETERMQLGNSINLKTTVSKEVAQNFAIGIGLGGGCVWGYNTDWNLVLDAGAVYKWGELGPMRNFRIGASVLDVGKVYNNTTVKGIWGKNDGTDWTTYPGFMTMKVGAAAEFVNTEKFTLGLSLDVTTPFFQNVIFDAGVQMLICDFAVINSSWQFDIQSCAAGCQSWLPTVGVGFRFGLDTSFTNKDAWKKSDLEVSAAWKNITGNVNAISTGVVLDLGQPDRKAPEIKMNVEFEEED